MKQQSLMQMALGEQWQQLPPSLKKHYQEDATGHNLAEGQLTIDYPGYMQLPLSVLRLMGALLNRRGKNIPTQVKRVSRDGREYWHRTISFPDGQQIHFKSQYTYLGANKFIEYINPFLGLKMAVHVEDERLFYASRGYVLKLGRFRIPIAEALALGHASIEEVSLNDSEFSMDFKMVHPLFGQIFSYAGVFKTEGAE